MKYDRLTEHLRRQTAGEAPMTFAEIETLIGAALPPSARNHRPWWSNNSSNSAHTRAWLDAGYKSERVDMGSERLVFRRTGAVPEPPESGAPADPLAGVYGCMEGTVRFLRDVDLAAPAAEPWAAEQA